MTKGEMLKFVYELFSVVIICIALLLIRQFAPIVQAENESIEDIYQLVEDTKTASYDPFNGYIDINLATADELSEINGVGEVIAQRIIEYRQENGDFRLVNELLEVSGIGPKKYQKMLPQLMINEKFLAIYHLR